MNPGNTNPKAPKGVDRVVEQINQKIAWLLGKNNSNKQPPKQTSNFRFSIIILCCLLMLWLITGFYYLGDNQYGLILRNGEIVKVENGMKVGFTAPYPFGDVEVINSDVSKFIDLSILSQNDPTILSRDLSMIKLNAKFDYQIYDPSVYFVTILQKQNNMDTYLSIIVQNELHSYLGSRLKSEILKSNLTVVASEIRDQVNQKISAYGIKIVKLNINSLNDVEIKQTIEAPKVESLSIADTLLRSANEYNQNVIRETKEQIAEFYELLPTYQKDPESVINQVYNEVQNSIPLPYPYPLLDMSLDDLIMLNHSDNYTDFQITSDSRERHFDRSVNRNRTANIGDSYTNEPTSGEHNNGD